MRKYLFILLMLPVLLFPLLAQNEDENDRGYSYWNRTKVGGAGGVTPIVGMFDNKEINSFLKKAGFSSGLGSDPMYLVGGEGYGYIMFLKNVRMGGFGVSGNRNISTLDLSSSIRKEVDYDITYGGFLVDYVRPIAHKLDIAIGATIGGGSVDITMRRDDGKFKDWNSIWSEYGNVSDSTSNYTRSLSGTFVTLNPHINIEYTLLTWLQLRIGIGYPIMLSPQWTLDDKYEINSVPSKMKANGYTINAGIMFGYFGW